MAHRQAKRERADRQDEIDREMRYIKRTLGGVQVRGIVGNTRVAHRMYPVANIKGTD